MPSSFMMRIDHPYVLREIERLPSGLMPFEDINGRPQKLVIKTSKELILTALARREFFIYLAPVEVSGMKSFSLISAFFDDPDEPLTIFTPLVEDAMLAMGIFGLVQSGNFEVFFFDQLNRERLGFSANSNIPNSTLGAISSLHNFPRMLEIQEIHSQCHTWFSNRSSEDDKAAIRIVLQDKLFAPDLVMVDLRNSGALNYIHVSSLSRPTNPGEMQELETSECLGRVIGNGTLLIGPVRRDNGREVADVVAITERSVFIIQAKDTENTERSINDSIERKISRSIKQVKGAMAQLRGAIRFCQLNACLEMRRKGATEVTKIDINGHTIYGIVIATELFDYEYERYAEFCLKAGQELGVVCVPLSFSQLAEYTFELSDEDRFVDALCTIYWQGILNGSFPRLRFNYPANDGG